MDKGALIDRQVVRAQLGRSPRGLFTVPVRCSYGFPQVIRVHPVIDGKPFPTLYWLTCPFLSKVIDGLEAEGWIKRLESELKSNPTLQAEMTATHRRYLKTRNGLLTADERRQLESNGRMRSLRDRGIGGIADWTSLKCLHLHAAHALADANPIGERVLPHLPATECDSKQVICSAYV